MTSDYNLWLNDINNRHSPTSLTHLLTGSLYTATAVISGVTTNSSAKMSLWDAYKDLRERLLDGETDILPESTTTQRDALSAPVAGTLLLNITTGREEIYSSSGSWMVVAGDGSNKSIVTWVSRDSLGIQATKTHQVQPWSSTSGLNESGTVNLGDQIVMTSSGTAKNLYVAVATAAGTGETHTFTIRQNGVDVDLKVILSNASIGNDTTNSFTFTAAALISLKVVGSSTCANSGQFTASIEIMYD